jgi:hypothetical protein
MLKKSLVINAIHAAEFVTYAVMSISTQAVALAVDINDEGRISPA